LAVEGDPMPPWLATLPGVEGVRGGPAGAELELLPSADPPAILAAILAHGAQVIRFDLAEPSLEALFMEHVGRPSGDEATLATGVAVPPVPAGGIA
jgi:ABC-type uncharacterized transport system ATPase subunit